MTRAPQTIFGIVCAAALLAAIICCISANVPA